MRKIGKILLYFGNAVVAFVVFYGILEIMWNYLNEFLLYRSGISIFSDGNLYLLFGGMICLGASICYLFFLSQNKHHLLNFMTFIIVFIAYAYSEYEDDSMSGLIVIYSTVPYIVVAYILLLIHYIHKRK